MLAPMVRSLVWLSLLVVLVLSVSPASAQDRIAFRDEGPPGAIEDLTAYAGSFAWMRETFESSVSRLVVRSRGGQRDATDEGHSTTGPIDIGSGGRAVYGRCEETADSVVDGRCDSNLFLYDLRAARERRMRGASHRDRSEATGAVWGRRLAFSRRGSGRDGIFVTRPLRRLSRRLAGELDLRGSRVTWLSPNGRTLFTKRFSRGGGGRACVLARARSSETFGSLTLGRHHAYWARGSAPTHAAELVRRRLPGRRCGSRGPAQVGRRLVDLPPFALDSIAVDGSRAFYYAGDDVVREMTDPPLSWR